MSNQLITASQLAQICQVTPRTIRWYQQIGLIKPIKIDKWNHYAYFLPEQALDIYKIKLLQQLNIPLKKASTKLKAYSFGEEVKVIENHIRDQKKLVDFLKQLNKILAENPKDLLKVETIGPLNLFCLKIKSGDYHKINQYLKELRDEANRLRVKTKGVGILFYLDPEMKFKPKDTPLELALIMQPKELKNSIPIPSCSFKKLPPIKVNTVNFVAPSLNLHDTFLPLIYSKLDEYFAKRNIHSKKPVMEIYLRCNPKKPNSIFSTKICYPT